MDGRALVDRQHPHDFFMNLSAAYRRPVGRGALWLQLAPVGEPALGPVAFMHRASAGENPTAPLGHHWLDSTHITSNVITVGWGQGRTSLEASAFHGREPDEHRWNLDGGAPDSVSARVKLLLGAGWSAQASHGFVKDAEQLVPGDLRRTTASLHYGERGDRSFAASLVWGRNAEDHGTSNAVLAEGAWQATAHDHFYARAEWVEKDDELLATKHLHEEEAGHDGSERGRGHGARPRAHRRLRAQRRRYAAASTSVSAPTSRCTVSRPACARPTAVARLHARLRAPAVGPAARDACSRRPLRRAAYTLRRPCARVESGSAWRASSRWARSRWRAPAPA